MKKKVMHVNFFGQIDDDRGGVYRTTLTQSLSNPYFEISSAGLGSKNSSYIYRDVRCFNFTESRLKNRFLNKFLGLNVFTYRNLVKVIETERPDILHFHTRPELVDTLFQNLSFQPKVIFQYHRHYEMPIIPAHADLLLAISQGVRSSVLAAAHTTTRFEVLYNPIHDHVRRVDTLTRPADGLSEPVLLYAGGKDPNKGFEQLMDAALRLDKEGVSFKLKVAGRKLDGFTSPSICVDVLGYLRPDQYFDELKTADVFLMPSFREGFGNAMVEALFFGRLCIGSDTPGLDEVISRDHGLVFNPWEDDALYNTLRDVLTRWQERQDEFNRLREAGQRFAARFEESNIKRQLNEYYFSVL